MLTAGGMFLFSAVIILIAGTKLSHYADRIAEHSGLGRLWIGVVLLAGATSLPEILTAVSAVLLDEPNIAVGNLVGAGLSNMLTLALIDLAYRQKRIWQQAALEHTLIAGLAIILTGLAGLLIVIRQPLPLWPIGLGTLAIALIYVLGMRVVFRQDEMRRRAQQLARMVDAEETAANHPVGTGALKRAPDGVCAGDPGYSRGGAGISRSGQGACGGLRHQHGLYRHVAGRRYDHAARTRHHLCGGPLGCLRPSRR